MSQYVQFCRRILLLVLMGAEDAKIKLPMDSMILIVKKII